MTHFRSALLLVLSALCAAAPAVRAAGDVAAGATAPQPRSIGEFLRIQDGDDGRPRALQVAVASYSAVEPGGDVTVDLIGAVHIGDPPYYAGLNALFTGYDVVLYELVAPAGTRVTPGREPSGWLSRAQLFMTEELGLTYQLDEIDYRAPNFVHADLSPSELKAAMAERGESPLVFAWRIFAAAMREGARDPLGLQSTALLMDMIAPESDAALKVTVARELLKMDEAQDILGDHESSSIIGARNERVVEVLRRELDRGAKRIGIFYGVGHLPDFERRLVSELDLSHDKTDWLDAWLLK
jgi:hypothetical protein